jgi:hypothetical protein
MESGGLAFFRDGSVGDDEGRYQRYASVSLGMGLVGLAFWSEEIRRHLLYIQTRRNFDSQKGILNISDCEEKQSKIPSHLNADQLLTF